MPVEFNEPIPQSSRPESARKMSGLSKLLIGTGLVKTEAGAQLVLFVIAVLAIAASAFLFVEASKGPPAPTLEQLIP